MRGSESKPGAQGARRARAPRRITALYLRRAALHYLERYAAPAAQLRRVLARKIAVSCRHHGEDPAIHGPLLDEVVAHCVALQLVDDRRFAEARAASLRRKGLSSRAVAGRLAAKGIGRELVAELATGGEGSEHAAARVAVRRKRLGRWRRPGEGQDERALRQRDLAALARLGFGFAVAQAVLDEEADPEELD
ncbi:MAG: regulatory protein RecX [Bosea sp. (in: a-proteobacteria)]|uniref:regulatory protein RecX n=1 Tax=Bosea sp. (in: a-proteobacteria) TaxID=1871050 RepID=UPI003F7CC852